MKEQEPREWVQVSEDDYANKLRALGQYFSEMIQQGEAGLDTLNREIEAIRYWRDDRNHRITYYFDEENGEMSWEHHEKTWGFRP